MCHFPHTYTLCGSLILLQYNPPSTGVFLSGCALQQEADAKLATWTSSGLLEQALRALQQPSVREQFPTSVLPALSLQNFTILSSHSD